MQRPVGFDRETLLFTLRTHHLTECLSQFDAGISYLDKKSCRSLQKKQLRLCKEETSLLGTLKPGQQVPNTDFQLKDELEEIWTRAAGSGNDPVPFPRLQYTQQDLNRWTMAARACEAFVGDDPSEEGGGYYGAAFRRRCGDFPRIEANEPAVALGLGVVALSYGGLHALAWSAHFISTTEQLLWRISACIVMGGVPLMFTIATITDRYNDVAIFRFIDDAFTYWLLFISVIYEVREEHGNTTFMVSVLGIVTFVAVLLVYALARAYLIVECFLQLSHLPADVYKVPQWSAYFPHIS